MLNIHVAASQDLVVQGLANTTVLRIIRETGAPMVGLVTAPDVVGAMTYQPWAEAVAGLLREHGVRVMVYGAALGLAPPPPLYLEHERAAVAARAKRWARGLEEEVTQPTREKEPRHTLQLVRRASGESDTIVAIYGDNEIRGWIESHGMTTLSNIQPGTVLTERPGPEFMIHHYSIPL